jgi:hypothetical protein
MSGKWKKKKETLLKPCEVTAVPTLLLLQYKGGQTIRETRQREAKNVGLKILAGATTFGDVESIVR